MRTRRTPGRPGRRRRTHVARPSARRTSTSASSRRTRRAAPARSGAAAARRARPRARSRCRAVRPSAPSRRRAPCARSESPGRRSRGRAPRAAHAPARRSVDSPGSIPPPGHAHMPGRERVLPREHEMHQHDAPVWVGHHGTYGRPEPRRIGHRRILAIRTADQPVTCRDCDSATRNWADGDAKAAYNLHVAISDSWDGLPPLVGREQEMEAIGRILAASRRHRPALVHVVGDPGLGKTRLLGEICEQAEDLGMLVLRGAGEGHRSGRVFGALAEPFASYVADEAATASDGDRPGRRPGPGRVWPGSATGGRRPPTTSAREPPPDAVRRVLTQLARRRPVLLALDDVQWSDEGTLDVLTSLTRRPPRGGVVVVLCYRPLPSLHALADARPGRIEGPVRGQPAPVRARGAHRAAAGAADPRCVAGPSPGALQRLRRQPVLRPGGARRCGGHRARLAGGRLAPGRRTQRARRRAGRPRPRDPAGRGHCRRRRRHRRPGPGGPGRRAVDERRARRPRRSVRADDLPAGRARADGSSGIRCWRVPCTTPSPPPLASGPITRPRSSWPRRGAPLAERARHLAVASTRGDLEAARTLAAAADLLAAQAPGQAASWYAAALDIAPQTESRWREEVELARARALVAVGRVDAAHAILHDFLAAADASDPERVAATALAARVAYLLGHHDEAEAILQRELSSDVQWSPGALAAVHVELATARLMSADFAGAREAAERALELAPTSDQPTVAGAAAAHHPELRGQRRHRARTRTPRDRRPPRRRPLRRRARLVARGRGLAGVGRDVPRAGRGRPTPPRAVPADRSSRRPPAPADAPAGRLGERAEDRR